MRNFSKRIYTYINIFRLIVPILLFKISDNKEKIYMDLNNLECELPFKKEKKISNFCYCLLRYKEFRNIFYLRVNNSMLLSSISKVFIKPLESLEVSGDIEGGLTIHHGHASVISPYKVGKNLSVWQNVTIGKRPSIKGGIDTPIIGNNVKIFTGAIVLGNITIGDNVFIGAGSVVTKNVPSNCTVVGNPARIVRKNGVKVSIEL